MLEKKVFANTLQGRVSNVLFILRKEYEIPYAEVARKLGQSKEHISRMANGKVNLTANHAYEIANKFPEVNLDFMLNGEGPMFHLEPLTVQDPKSNYITAKSKQLPKTLAIYDLDVQAGTMPLFDDVSKDPIESISFLGSEQCDFAVKVHGESMTGKIANGGIVAVKEINDLEIIPFGHIFLIFTSDLRMVKYIRKSKVSKDHIRLCSHNPDFEDFDIHRSKIIRLFIVKKILNDES